MLQERLRKQLLEVLDEGEIDIEEDWSHAIENGENWSTWRKNNLRIGGKTKSAKIEIEIDGKRKVTGVMFIEHTQNN